MDKISCASRVLLLGASNLSLELSTAVRVISRNLPGPIDYHIADGFGRSYGRSSRFLDRALPGTVECDLWADVGTLNENDELPMYALITDVGNDIAYGVEPIEIGKWVEMCVERLESWRAKVVITGLPGESLARLSQLHLTTVRNLFFPSCQLSAPEIHHRVHKLDDIIMSITDKHGIALVRTDLSWYGIDPVHVQRKYWPGYWQRVVENWIENNSDGDDRSSTDNERLHADPWLWCYLWTRWAKRRRVLGGLHERIQPSGHLRDGSLISVY